MLSRPHVLDDVTGTGWEALRASRPLVQCLTNGVVLNFTANVLLAIGATPAMVDIPGEAGGFAAEAAGVLVNLGMPTGEQSQAMCEAAGAAGEAGTPWVLDPVAVGSLRVRTELARQLLAMRPTVLRGNPSEIIALAGAGTGGCGVDTSDSVDDAVSSARALARLTGGVVAVSGPVDLVVDPEHEVWLENGDAMLTRITGGGCALGGVIAALAGCVENRFMATVVAVTAYNIAAELAAVRCSGPGTFVPAFLDALAGLEAQDLRERAVIR